MILYVTHTDGLPRFAQHEFSRTFEFSDNAADILIGLIINKYTFLISRILLETGRQIDCVPDYGEITDSFTSHGSQDYGISYYANSDIDKIKNLIGAVAPI